MTTTHSDHRARGRAYLFEHSISPVVIDDLERLSILRYERDGFGMSRFDPGEGTATSRWSYRNCSPTAEVGISQARLPPLICGHQTAHVWLLDSPLEALRLWTLFDSLQWIRPIVVVTNYADYDQFPRLGVMQPVIQHADRIYLTVEQHHDRQQREALRKKIAVYAKPHACKLIFSGAKKTVCEMLRSAAEGAAPHRRTDAVTGRRASAIRVRASAWPRRASAAGAPSLSDVRRAESNGSPPAPPAAIRFRVAQGPGDEHTQT
ncbi:MAG: hypothetical protein AAFN74_26320 [Myxococcota bacterium]